MKINKQQAFSPITITFETREEAEHFWSLMLSANVCNDIPRDVRDMCKKISDWISNTARL